MGVLKREKRRKSEARLRTMRKRKEEDVVCFLWSREAIDYDDDVVL